MVSDEKNYTANAICPIKGGLCRIDCAMIAGFMHADGEGCSYYCGLKRQFEREIDRPLFVKRMEG